MIEIVLTFIGIYFFFRLLSSWFARYLLYKHRKQTGQDGYEQSTSQKNKRKKVFTKEDGEYVEYEDIHPTNPDD